MTLPTIRTTLGATLALSLAFALPTADARAAAIQTLDEQALTASQFNSLFDPMSNTPAMNQTYQYAGAPVSGSVGSQVFEGKEGTAAAGLYAYAYSLAVASGTTNGGEPLHTDSASFQYNATPLGTDLSGAGKTTYSYAITDGSIGSLSQAVAAPGGLIQTPVVSWQAGQAVGTIRAQFVDPSQANTQPLGAGANSSIFVILSSQPPTTQLVNLQSSLPTSGNAPAVYAATGGSIQPIPAPEPATVLAWAGMIGAGLFVRRVRRTRG